jgi:hypothetical protein
MRPHAGETIGARVGVNQSIDEILVVLLAAEEAVGVEDLSGNLVGVVDRGAVISVLDTES